MAEHSIATTARPTAERREGGMAEQVWRSTDYLVRGRFEEAHDALVARREKPTPATTLDLARAMHTADLADAPIEDWTTSHVTANRVALVTLEMPQTAAAHGRLEEGNSASRADRTTDKLTVSRFNQNLAEAMAYMPPSMLATFPTELRRRSSDLLRDEWHVATLANDNYNRIISGISREVALWRAAEAELPEGWEIVGATPEEDLRGTDIIIYDADDNELRLDSKTDTGFNRAVKKQYDDGYMTAAEAEAATTNGYFYKSGTTPGGEPIQNCIVNADSLGKVRNFEYEDTEPVMAFIEKQFAEQRGRRLRKVGKTAITT
ncbi:MAG TPA: hypothetical protein VLA88_04910 [Candidatus Saccharimonadales bacterium]|nr:hypothetical protein [Candidatus Saccharimonadales bacterium]